MPDMLQIALAHHQRGEFAQAASMYESILKTNPDHPDALHLLGLICSGNGEHARAIQLIERACELHQQNPTFLSNLGIAYRKAERYDDAIDAYRRSLQLTPNNPSTLFNLGKSLRLSGHLAEAKEVLQKAIALQPDKSSPWLTLMNIAAEQENIETAIEIGKKAAEACPQDGLPLVNLGVMYSRLDEAEQALRHYRKAIDISPKNVKALCKLASTLVAEHQLDEAEHLLKRAQTIDADHGEVLNGLGMLHKARGQKTEAVTFFQRAIARDEQLGSAHVNLSLLLKEQGQLSNALRHVERGIALEPGSYQSQVNHAAILMFVGRIAEAAEILRDTIERRGGYSAAHQALLMCEQYRPGVTAASLAELHREWYERYAVPLAPNEPLLPRPRRAAGDKIRLGFVSPDLGCHPVGYFTVGFFEGLDKSQFSLTIYSDRLQRDALTERIEKTADIWHETIALSDDELFQQIRGDEIDILFDLAGHTAGNRLLVFARRAAPIQISWAGYVGTTGLHTMDYLIADRWHIPEGEEDCYVEKIIRMPESYVAYTPPHDVPAPAERPHLRRGHLTFGSFCNPAKVNEGLLEWWGSILAGVPDSRLLLCYCGWPDPANVARVQTVLDRYGVAEQVEFAQESGYQASMARYAEVDIALDTAPYSGGLTTLEAIAMGVPTLTRPGQTFAGRHSLSHLQTASLADAVVGQGAHGDLPTLLQNMVERLVVHNRNGKQRVTEFGEVLSDRLRQIAKA